VRLVRAELRKLARPLTVATLCITGFFCLFQATVHLFNGSQQLAALTAEGSMVPVPTDIDVEPPPCSVLGLPVGSTCEAAQRDFIDGRRKARELAVSAQDQQIYEVRKALVVRGPLGAALLGIGMWASVPGALAVMLLAAGHIANEWSGRTLKTILIQDGRRVRLLGAKMLTLWVAACGLMLATGAFLALVSPLLAAAFPMDAGSISASVGIGTALGYAARATLVLAAFAAIGTLASVLTRSTLGAMFLGVAAVVASLAGGAVPKMSPLTLGYWVSGWMGFHPRSLIPRVWVELAGAAPGRLTGLVALVILVGSALSLAAVRFRRIDVTD